MISTIGAQTSEARRRICARDAACPEQSDLIKTLIANSINSNSSSPASGGRLMEALVEGD
jgi:hypothetical protein